MIHDTLSGQILIFRLNKRFNSSFTSLTFLELRFWSSKKKRLQNRTLSFATVAVLAPQGQEK